MPNAIAVYTALFGHYDVLQEPAADTATCDFICFSDDETLRSGRWKIIPLAATMDPGMMNRHVKLHPHLYLPEYEVSIYVDANLKVRRDPAELVEKYLTRTPFAAPRHPVRNCVYDEIQTCIETGKTDAATGNAQAAGYRASGYPAQNGLTENRVLIRRHHEPAVRELMEAWWAELVSGVRRDQASLQVVCWKMGFELQYMSEDILCGDHFVYRPHKKERLTVQAKVQVLVALKRLRRLRRQLFAVLHGRRLESR